MSLSQSELLSCPFCGSEAAQQENGEIACLNDDCVLSESWNHEYKNIEHAEHMAKLWNTRAHPPEIVEDAKKIQNNGLGRPFQKSGIENHDKRIRWDQAAIRLASYVLGKAKTEG